MSKRDERVRGRMRPGDIEIKMKYEDGHTTTDNFRPNDDGLFKQWHRERYSTDNAPTVKDFMEKWKNGDLIG